MRFKLLATILAVVGLSLLFGSPSVFASNPFASTTIVVDQTGQYNNGFVTFSSNDPIFGFHGSATTWDLSSFGDVSNWTVGVEVQLLREGETVYGAPGGDGVIDDLCRYDNSVGTVPNCLDLGVDFSYSSHYQPSTALRDYGSTPTSCGYAFYGTGRRKFENYKCILTAGSIYDYQIRLNVINSVEFPGTTYYSSWFPINPPLRFSVGVHAVVGGCDYLGFPSDLFCKLFEPGAGGESVASFDFLSDVLNKPPFGYVSALVAEISDVGSTTSTSTEMDFNASVVSSLPVFFEPFDTALSIVLWFVFLIYLFKRFAHFEL